MSARERIGDGLLHDEPSFEVRLGQVRGLVARIFEGRSPSLPVRRRDVPHCVVPAKTPRFFKDLAALRARGSNY